MRESEILENNEVGLDFSNSPLRSLKDKSEEHLLYSRKVNIKGNGDMYGI